MDASVFLEKLDDKRSGMKPPGSLCASCGKREPAPGFAMCVVCRAEIRLGSDEEVRVASEATAHAENARRMRAHQAFVNRTATPIKEVIMPDKTYVFPCPIEGCDGGGKSAQGLRIHGAKAHGGSTGLREAIATRIDEIEPKDETLPVEQQGATVPATTPDPARTTVLPPVTVPDMRMELVDTKLELVIQRLVSGQFEECERMVDDLDRVRELLRA